MATLPYHDEWQILRLASKDEGRIRGAEAGAGARTLHGACNDLQEPPPGERASQSSGVFESASKIMRIECSTSS